MVVVSKCQAPLTGVYSAPPPRIESTAERSEVEQSKSEGGGLDPPERLETVWTIITG